MKTCISLFRVITAVLLAVASLAFIIIEGALLLSGDFRLYENPAIALAQQFVRLLLPAVSLTVGLRALIHARHRRFRPESLCFAASAALTAPFASNRIGVYCFLLCALFALSQWIGQEET
jgi:hypothetical protein